MLVEPCSTVFISSATLDFVQNNPGELPRVAFITVGSLGGFILGYRGEPNFASPSPLVLVSILVIFQLDSSHSLTHSFTHTLIL